MAGTNPDQGAALARATAETLANRPGLAIITTHYDSLKALGESDERFANAAMAYDLEALRPTFRLATGAPGRSYAFDIAARMGLPEGLLERARALAGASSVGLESVIARLQARESTLVKESQRLAEAEAAASATAEAQREAAAALARRERELGSRPATPSRPPSRRRVPRWRRSSATRSRRGARAPPRPGARRWTGSARRRWRGCPWRRSPPPRRWRWWPARACSSSA